MSELTQDQQLQQLEISLEEAQREVARATALKKLENNQYFKELLLDDYLGSNATRLVKLKASMPMQTPEHQTNICQQIDAIGQLNQWFLYIAQTGELAEKAIEDYEQAKVDILSDQAEDNTVH